MNTLFNVWVIPTKHKSISQKLNMINPPYIPIATNVEEKLLPRYRDMFDAQTMITDIGPSVKFMLTGDGERRLARDCKVYGEMDGSLVLHELYQDIDMEDFLMMFPETAKMSVVQEDLDAVLCFSKRSLEYPFPYELFVPDEYDFLNESCLYGLFKEIGPRIIHVWNLVQSMGGPDSAQRTFAAIQYHDADARPYFEGNHRR
jgi:hypothetical protein